MGTTMLTSEEFNKARESLIKASIPFANLVLPIKEPDTYTLIPNGKGEYLVQHDQSGCTLPYRERRVKIERLYKDGHGYKREQFETFYNWSNSTKAEWKRNQIANMKQEANKPMSTCTINPYEYWDLESLYDCLDTLIWDDEDPYYDEEKYRMVNEAIDKLEKEENNMHCYNSANTAIVAAAQPESVDQREYLLNRLRDVSSKKEKDLFAFFKLNPVAGPKTVKDLVQKIKDGDFAFDENEGDEYIYWNTESLVSNIRWTKDKPDRKGYDAAIALKRDAYTKTVDTIKIMSPEEGLKALQAFEAQDFH